MVVVKIHRSNAECEIRGGEGGPFISMNGHEQVSVMGLFDARESRLLSGPVELLVEGWRALGRQDDDELVLGGGMAVVAAFDKGVIRQFGGGPVGFLEVVSKHLEGGCHNDVTGLADGQAITLRDPLVQFPQFRQHLAGRRLPMADCGRRSSSPTSCCGAEAFP